MNVLTVKPLTEQDIREHRLIARIERLEAEVQQVIEALRDDTQYIDPIAEAMGSLH